MAAKYERNGKYIVIQQYLDGNGVKRKKWHSFSSEEEAKDAFPEIEKAEKMGRIYKKPRYARKQAIHYENAAEQSCVTVKDIVESYYEQHCAEGGWRARTASGSRGIIEHYIYPFIGDEPIENVSTYYIQQYYADLLTHDAVKQKDGQTVKISPRMVRDVKKILNPAFRYAIQMGLLTTNPVTDAKLPRESKKSYQQWDAEEALEALQNCDDFELMVMISLMISGPMRIGELLALHWDDIIRIPNDPVGKLDIHYELARLNKADVERTGTPIHFVFPETKENCTTMLVLTNLKNENSKRNDYLPPTVLQMFDILRERNEEWKAKCGDAVPDFGLVFHQQNGRPITDKMLSHRFHKYVRFGTIRDVVFYSLRHSGATIQMAVSGNDIKAVQANMGHATPDMLMSVYLSPMEKKRREIALKLEEELFSKLDLSAFSGDEDNTRKQE